MADVSPRCGHGEHADCRHLVGARADFRPKRFVATLCPCSCHHACPLARTEVVPFDSWKDECTCPGKQRFRELEGARELEVARALEEAEARGERLRRALERLDLTPATSQEEMRELIVSSLAAAEASMPDVAISFAVRRHWIERGPRLLVRPRLLWAATRATVAEVGQLVRWAREAGPDPSEQRRPRRPGSVRLPGGIETDRGGAITISIPVVCSAAAAVAAVRAQGRRRRALTSAALVLATPAVMIYGLMTLIGLGVRAAHGYTKTR